MEELVSLRNLMEAHRYGEALELIAEMEDMARSDIRTKIYSFIKVLLQHLMKRQAEQRSTRSWDLSVENALDQISLVNARNDAGSQYFNEEELLTLIEKAYSLALGYAAAESFEGQFTEREFAQKLNSEVLKQQALDLILNYKN
ncbi:MAG: DUF29 domain-containing protein [Cytophagaceae bacterium]|nr:DUF29 domain-containing protein [Cytophagaceae bacterium]